MKERVRSVRVEEADGWNATESLPSTRVGPGQRNPLPTWKYIIGHLSQSQCSSFCPRVLPPCFNKTTFLHWRHLKSSFLTFCSEPQHFHNREWYFSHVWENLKAQANRQSKSTQQYWLHPGYPEFDRIRVCADLPGTQCGPPFWLLLSPSCCCDFEEDRGSLERRGRKAEEWGEGILKQTPPHQC